MKKPAKSELYQKLPSVDELTQSPEGAALALREGRVLVVDAARRVLSRVREQITNGELGSGGIDHALSGLPRELENEVRRSSTYSLRAVINATGVILHTNLGRAPLAHAAIEHIRNTAGCYSNLEFDTEDGERGRRDVHVDRLFRSVFGPEVSTSTIVVNNNAAAVLLALNTLADGGEVIVSRGELVEIGGSFRIPEIMSKSNAIMREVGTTNRTTLSDYQSAITEKTKVLLRVHRSNFEITGFTARPTPRELASLAHAKAIPLIEDLGSGCFFDLRSVGVKAEPGVLDSLQSGTNVVTYSGDKLLGGPQAGIISGDPALVSRMRGNPLFRALRVGKLTYAALEGTMLQYVKDEYDAIPTLRLIRLTKKNILERAKKVAETIQSHIKVELMDGMSVIGGGAAPSATLPTTLLALRSARMAADEIMSRLRKFDPPIIARVEADRVLIDLRTVFPEEDDAIAAAVDRLAKLG